MTEKKQTGKVIIVLALICAIGAGLLTGVNALTAPLIEANNASLAFGPLFEVMPDAKDFNSIYSAADPAASALADVPETVTDIYEEVSGQGYAVKLSITQGYTGDPIEFTMGVSTDGKITGAQVTAYNDSKDFGQTEYPLTYVGQDSALADVSLVAGVTYSSSAFKNAVSDAFTALIREVFGSAQIAGLAIPFMEDFTVPVLTKAPGGFFVLAVVCAIFSSCRPLNRENAAGHFAADAAGKSENA